MSKSKRKRERKRKRWSHPHYLVAAVDVDDLAGDGRGAVAGEEHASAPSSSGATALERRVGLVVLQHRVKPLMPRAASVFTGPALMQLTRIFFGPRS